ncbi:class I adenylate cyclase [Desulfobacula sp.]|uniref:class I adenylate cyclase n=1 Tax=Desulfobacula sp. TaxID=2593537 RepID=UPI00261398CA|nr:class I adenylate cyclase [Desulfobacula sp.]
MDFLVKDFDFNRFEPQWEKLSEEEKAIVVKKVGNLDPRHAILPILAGISSYHFYLRNNARKSLEVLQDDIRRLLSAPSDTLEWLEGAKASASICARISAHIHPEMHFNDLSYFYRTLLEFDGKGAFFAYKLVYRGKVSVTAMEKIIFTVSEPARLSFVDQYLQTEPSVRMKFNVSFIRILRSLKQRKPVVEFYAGLFDRQRDVDPFLGNINADLRDPDQIISNELRSRSSDIAITGLKALAMMVTKIPPEILINILTAQNDKNVRLAIYQIVENSSMGMYPELFSPMMDLLYTCDQHEAFAAFKAMVVSGKLPLYTLLETIKKQYPTLMPVIQNEMAALSRISFFIIQDIALNKEKYRTANVEVNLACILGMIKKRPERVVKILKKYGTDPKNSLRKDINRFIEKTKHQLSKEKQSIETEFDAFVQGVKQESKINKGFMQNFFLSPVEKKIEALKNKTLSNAIDFENETIQDVDLSAGGFFSASLFFSNCRMHNCDLSKASFSGVFFKNSLFYNIDMRDAQFDGVNFDNAVFINVNAQRATFKNCSFQQVSIYNCNFNGAGMMDVSFLSAIISKTSFNQTNLSCACFAYSKISAVSFVNSNVEQADFSGVGARFCRFPPTARSLLQNSDMDCNAREFQLSLTDMPPLDETIVAQINLLIFCEFIHYGEMKFVRQNQLSLLTAFDVFKTKQADLFQLIPFLLHENIGFPNTPSFHDETPHGICDYMPSLEAQDILKKYIRLDTILVRRSQHPSIEGLFTIGSTGSIAQTSDSDIDYWVCINEDNFSPRGLELFKQKLDTLERMAGYQFNTKVTFFLVDIFKARNNDFGGSTVESSGSAQTRLLKEEFYRTMIYIAGKLPLWAVLPTTISLHYYNSVLKNVSSFPDLGRYIDLGDIHAISTSEYVGASIWQMFKWLKSPFKSVIKMSLLEKYIYEYGKSSLLCNQYKDEWMNSGTHLKLAQNDAYYILIENLITYYQTAGDASSVHLLLTCFFLKLEISQEAQIENTVFGLRKILLEKCLTKWGWNKDKIFEIGSFKTWAYSDIATLSNTIKTYMLKTYKIVNNAFERRFHDQSRISPEDRTVLGRKVLIEFSKQPGKVEKVLLISRSDRHFNGLQLNYFKRENGIGSWALLHKKSRTLNHQEDVLIKTETIEEIGAWLINNCLYNASTILNLVPNPTEVTIDDIRKLYNVMHDFFSPVLERVIGFDELLKKNTMVCLFISINFYAPRQQRNVSEYTAVYLNSWGEMFCRSYSSDQGVLTMEQAKKHIMTTIGVKKLPKNTAFYFSKGIAR